MKSDVYPNTWFNPTKAEVKDSCIKAPIAFDMDGVLSETGEILYFGICNAFGVDQCRTIVDGYQTFQYAIEGVDQLEMFDTVNKIIGDQSVNALAVPFMTEVLTYVYLTTGNPITIVTARTKENMKVTYQWLAHNLPKNVPFNLIMVNGMQKEVVLKRIENNIFIDDRYKTIAKLEQCIDLAVLYKRDWNQGRPVEAGDMTITDLRDLIPLVNYLTRNRIMDWPGNIPYPERLGYEIGKLYA